MLVITFAAIIAAFFLLILFLPKHTGEISQLEFRKLAESPLKGLTAETAVRQIAEGTLSKNTDTFLEDHFPARGFFIAVNSYYSRLTGRNAVQTVLTGKNGRMFDQPVEVNEAQLERNLGFFEKFAQENGMQAELVIVPTSAYYYEEELPALHPVYHDAEALEYFKQHTVLDYVDVAETFRNAEEPLSALASYTEYRPQLYYRTDHHWNLTGAYVCYREICERWGEEPVSLDAFTELEEYEFYGSIYRKSGAWLTKPDTLHVLRSPALDSAKVTIGDGDNAKVYTGVYDDTQLVDGWLDKYAAYLYGNNALTVIENPEATGEPIMIVKDSYGNSLAPFFVMTHRIVVMIDTRNYGQMTEPSEIAERYGVEKLIIVLGLDSAASENSYGYLR